jgi:hypothetical protein
MAKRYKGNREEARALRATAEIARAKAATHWRAKDRHEAIARAAEERAQQADAEADALEGAETADQNPAF